MPRSVVGDRDAIFNRLEEARAWRAGAVLSRTDRMQPRVGARGPKYLRLIPGRWQVKCCERRHAGRRKVSIEIDPMQMHDVHRPLPQSGCDSAAMLLLGD